MKETSYSAVKTLSHNTAGQREHLTLIAEQMSLRSPTPYPRNPTRAARTAGLIAAERSPPSSPFPHVQHSSRPASHRNPRPAALAKARQPAAPGTSRPARHPRLPRPQPAPPEPRDPPPAHGAGISASPPRQLSPSTTPQRKRREPSAVSVSVSVSSPPGTAPAAAPGGSRGAPDAPAGLGLPWGSSKAACPSFCTILPPAARTPALRAEPPLPTPLLPFVSAAPGRRRRFLFTGPCACAPNRPRPVLTAPPAARRGAETPPRDRGKPGTGREIAAERVSPSRRRERATRAGTAGRREGAAAGNWRAEGRARLRRVRKRRKRARCACAKGGRGEGRGRGGSWRLRRQPDRA